jgi:small-conductance mechanosensitive channel
MKILLEIFNIGSIIYLLNFSLLGIIIIFWLLTNRWINKNLERFLKQKGWLVSGREKNIKKLLKQILLLFCFFLSYMALSYGHPSISVAKITHLELFGFDQDKKDDTGNFIRYSFTLSRIFVIIFVLLIARISLSILRVVIYRSTKEKKWIDEGGKYTIIQLSKYIIYTFAMIGILQGVGIEPTVLLAGSAALFVGIGFGLQSILADVFSGIILLFDGSVKVGDVVEMPGQEICKVEHIFIRTSHVKTLDGKMLIVPNSNLTKENVINWTISDKVTRFNIELGVAYGSDTQKVKDVLYQCVLKHPQVEKTMNINVTLEDFGEYALKFKVYFWAIKTWEIINIKSDIRFAIDQAFRANGIKIPFPQRDLHLISDQRKEDNSQN